MIRKLMLPLLASLAVLAAACSGGGGDDGATVAANGADSQALAERSRAANQELRDEASGAGEASSSAALQRAVAAIERTQQAGSYAFAMSFLMDGGTDLGGTFALSVDGAIDVANARMRMRLDMSDLFQALGDSAAEAGFAGLLGDGVIEFRSIDETVYIRMPLFAALFGASTEWISFDSGESNPLSDLSGAGQLDPGELLAMLTALDAIEEAGVETLRGVETVHYSGVLDYDTLLQTLSAAEYQTLQSQYGTTYFAELEAPIDLWIDNDGLVRRFTLTIDLAGLGLPADVAAEVGVASMDIEFFDFGEPVLVNAPPPDEVTPLDGAGLFDGSSLFSGDST